jgi:hypothetical protein
MASVQKCSLDELCEWINSKIDEHEVKMDGGCKLMIRAMVAEIMRKLAQNDGSYEQAFQWWAVGVDPSNRYGDGLDPERVHKLIVAIFAAGFVWEETTNAVAREIDPNDKKKEDIDMNIQLAIASEDMLPPVDPDKIKILTLSNGHTTAGLGCFGHGVKVVLEELQFLCQDSRLSLAKLRELQPAYAEAVDKGLTYKVIRTAVLKRCPRLPFYVQEAYNTTHQTAQYESCFQVMRKIHMDARRMQQSGKSVDWKALATRVGSTRPSHAEQVHGYAAFVEKHVDEAGQLLNRLGQNLKSVAHKAAVRGANFKALAELPMVDAAEYVEAMVLLMYDPGDKRFYKNGYSVIFASCDIQTLGKGNQPRALRCAKILREFRATLVDKDVSDRVVNKCVGELGKALVAHVHAKSKEHNDIECCKWAVWEQLTRDYIDELDEVPPPRSWGKKPNAKEESTVGEPTKRMGVLKNDGSVDITAQLDGLGFKVGKTVKPKKENATVLGTGIYKIESITKKNVTIIDTTRGGLSHEVTRVVEHGDFAAKYMHWKDMTPHVVFPVTDSSQSAQWKAEMAMSQLKAALDQAWAANFARVAGRVHIVLKKGAFAKTDIDTGELVIVPLTHKTSFALASGAVLAPTDVLAHDFGYEGANGKKYVCVIKGVGAKETDKNEDIVLYFNVTNSTDRAEANMARTTVNATIKDKTYKVPVLINVVPLKAGDALRTYSKAATDPTVELAVVPIAPFPKPTPKVTAAAGAVAPAPKPTPKATAAAAGVVAAKAPIAPQVPKPPAVAAKASIAPKRRIQLGGAPKRRKQGPV